MGTAEPSNICYSRSDVFFANYARILEDLILKYKAKSVLEVGGGANPSFSLEEIAQNGWQYTVLDVAEGELAKAPGGYSKIHADISSPNLSIPQTFDFIFSKMLIEHVVDAEAMHRNIQRLLTPNGVVFHFFPTLYALPYLINQWTPEWISGFILRLAHPERHAHGPVGKFPAYYRWCFGPTAKQIRRFEKLGYRVELYAGLYGHSYYYEKLPILPWLHERIVRFLLRHPIPSLTSYAYVLLRKDPR
jgi:ubiquinone/menaquinone biosynthesis C-methylase UbiE